MISMISNIVQFRYIYIDNIILGFEVLDKLAS